MTGADTLLRTAVSAGVEICFANPGTTEMPLVAALDRVPGVRAVLGLFEGVCTGAADGYGRMRERPAMTLLHLGPGFANGIANLHNARRARTPVVNVIGDHATWHLAADAPLTSDIVSLATPVSGWVKTTRTAAGLARDFAEAVAAARRPPGQVATLVVPADCQWEPASEAAAPLAPAEARSASSAAVDAAARLLRGGPALVLLGGGALRERGVRAAGRIAAAAGAKLFSETFPARVERGLGRARVDRLPYFPDQVQQTLSERPRVVLAGAREPVAFFGYPGGQSRLVPDGCEVVVLASAEDDVAAALEALADALGARAADVPAAPAPTRPEGELTAGTLGAAGAALACPDRPVISLQADGSAMYTLQALWTQAREGLNVKTVLCNNRSYRILQIELFRSGHAEPGTQSMSLTDLDRPALDWVSLAKGLGVPGARVERAEDLARTLERAIGEPGPFLIDAALAG